MSAYMKIADKSPEGWHGELASQEESIKREGMSQTRMFLSIHVKQKYQAPTLSTG